MRKTSQTATPLTPRQILDAACERNVAIEIHHRNRQDELTVSRSRLLVIQGDTLYVDQPQAIGGQAHYTTAQPLDVYFSADDTLHHFSTQVLQSGVVVSLNASRRVVGMALMTPKSVNAGQRRQNFRIGLASADEIAVDLHTASASDPNACPIDARHFSAKLVDLSLGGAAVRVRHAVYSSFHVGECFFMSFYLPGEPAEVRCLAQVRQTRDILDGAATRLGVHFLRWPTAAAMRQHSLTLQRFITRMQRAMLKRAG